MATGNNPEEHLMMMGEAPPLMVRVRAPASLPAGFTFEANLNDDPNRPFICEVVSLPFWDLCESWHHFES